jgi:transcriptional regulator with XRE-family HTH domain
MDEVTTWVRLARKAAKLTQDQLGDLVGVGKANISRWEGGFHSPSYGQIIRIAQATGAALPLPVGVVLPPSTISARAWSVALAIDSLPDGPQRGIAEAVALNIVQQLRAQQDPPGG